MTLTIGSLFSGLGGLELGLEWAGLGPVLWQVEIDPFCISVLARHWPDIERFTDVTTRRSWPAVDLICGGFPCTDVSGAGKRRGLGGSRSGLWYHFARIVSEVRPQFVVVENVASGASKWLRPVRHQLHLFGYRTRALGIGAADVGAPHRRKRVFVVAYAHRVRLQGAEDSQRRQREGSLGRQPTDPDGSAPVADPDGGGLAREWFTQLGGLEGSPRSLADGCGPARQLDDESRDRASAQPSLGRVPVGLPPWLDRWPAGPQETPHAWEPPRLVTEKVVNRVARLRALGNCVVPAVARVVGEVIQQIEAGHADSA